jgi:hypothetical protein
MGRRRVTALRAGSLGFLLALGVLPAIPHAPTTAVAASAVPAPAGSGVVRTPAGPPLGLPAVTGLLPVVGIWSDPRAAESPAGSVAHPAGALVAAGRVDSAAGRRAGREDLVLHPAAAAGSPRGRSPPATGVPS